MSAIKSHVYQSTLQVGSVPTHQSYTTYSVQVCPVPRIECHVYHCAQAVLLTIQSVSLVVPLCTGWSCARSGDVPAVYCLRVHAPHLGQIQQGLDASLFREHCNSYVLFMYYANFKFSLSFILFLPTITIKICS